MAEQTYRRLWGRPYDEGACNKAWETFYTSFNGEEPGLSHRGAAARCGVGVAEMLCYGLDRRLIDPDNEAEAQEGLKHLRQLEVPS